MFIMKVTHLLMLHVKSVRKGIFFKIHRQLVRILVSLIVKKLSRII